MGNEDVQGRVFAWSAYKEEGETDKNAMTGCLLLCGIRSLVEPSQSAMERGMTAILSESNHLNTIMGHAHCIHTYIHTYILLSVCISARDTSSVKLTTVNFQL